MFRKKAQQLWSEMWLIFVCVTLTYSTLDPNSVDLFEQAKLIYCLSIWAGLDNIFQLDGPKNVVFCCPIELKDRYIKWKNHKQLKSGHLFHGDHNSFHYCYPDPCLNPFSKEWPAIEDPQAQDLYFSRVEG